MADRPQAFNEWHKVVATMPTTDARVRAFADITADGARLVSRGLAKADVVDELFDIARSHGLIDAYGADEIQTLIADAFTNTRIEPEEIWPEARKVEAPRQRTNGEHRGPRLPLASVLSKADFIKGFVPPDYLIDGVFQRRFIYALTGQTGHAKTAVALLLAQLVSSSDYNATLGTHRVEKGRVVYFVGENPDDVRMRVIGIDAQRDDEPADDDIFFVPGVFDIEAMLARLEADAREHGLISLVIVDTSAAYFLGNDEVSNTQMGGYARTLRKLTTLPGGPCVLVLCHPIKHVIEPSQLLPRGGGAFLAEVDGNLTLWRTSDDTYELFYNKLRGPGFQALAFKTESIRHERLKDQKGRLITTVRAVVISTDEEERRQTDDKSREDQLLAKMLGAPEGSCSSWAQELGWVDDKGEPRKKFVQRMCEKLANAKLTRCDRQQWSLTDKGKEVARRAALDAANRRHAEQTRGGQTSLDF